MISIFLLSILAISVVNAQMHDANFSSNTQHRQLIAGNAACGFQRVRKSWDAMVESERALYLRAVEVAIENQVFQPFVKIHVEKISKMEGHDTCGFMLWHRRYLLAYENMLRDLGNEFKCVTTPYWDTMSHYQRQSDGKCGNFQECSKIFTALGGLPGEQVSRVFSSHRAAGRCYSGQPISKLCDDNNQCGCLPRADISKIGVPQGSSFASLFNIIPNSKTYAEFTNTIKLGMHGEVHNAVNGILSTWSASYDPLFFSWHATVDMLMSVYHECHVPNPLLGEARFTSAFVFNQEKECRMNAEAKDTLKEMSSKSNVYMVADGVDVRNHPTLGKYFQDIGTTYGEYADARSMGDYSYRYNIPSGFNRMLQDPTKCASARTPVTPAPIVTPAPVVAIEPVIAPAPDMPTTPVANPVPATPAAGPITALTPSVIELDEPKEKNAPTPLPTVPTAVDQLAFTSDSIVVNNEMVGNVQSNQDGSITQQLPESPADAQVPEEDESNSEYWKWYETTKAKLTEKFPNNQEQVAKQLEFLDCIGYNAKFGVRKFTDNFIKDFMEGQDVEPRCQNLIEQAEENTNVVDIADEAEEWGINAIPSNGTTISDISTPKLAKKLEEIKAKKIQSSAMPLTISASAIMIALFSLLTL